MRCNKLFDWLMSGDNQSNKLSDWFSQDDIAGFVTLHDQFALCHLVLPAHGPKCRVKSKIERLNDCKSVS